MVIYKLLSKNLIFTFLLNLIRQILLIFILVGEGGIL